MDDFEAVFGASVRIAELPDGELMAARVALDLAASRLPVASPAAGALFELAGELGGILAGREAYRRERGGKAGD